MDFEVKGSVKQKDGERKFSIIVRAETESGAKENTYSFFGSKQGASRAKITIDSIEQTKPQ